MNRLGISSFAWTSPFTAADAGLVAKAKEMGFDLLEVVAEQPERIDPDALRSAAERCELGLTVCGAFGPGRDLASEEREPRRAAADYLRALIDLAATLGADLVAGPMYSETGKARLVPERLREQERARAVQGLRAAADYAQERGVRLALEPLNRFETDMVNTAAQGLELCDRVERANVGLLLDTFHMNIEEKSLARAIGAAGCRLFHFHACENDRGTPGSGSVDWAEALGALLEIDYAGAIVIEFFSPGIEEIARATCQWRRLEESGDVVAADGGRFLKAMLAQVPS